MSLRRLTVGALATLSVLVAAAPAGASPLIADAGDCGPQPLSKPFTPYLDYMDYTRLSSGTQSLASGDSVVSPSICVGLVHPTLRFFAKRDSGFMLTSSLRVEVLYTDADGVARSLPIGTVLNGGSRQPTLPIPIVISALALDGQTSVAFRYTAVGSGDWSIGDVWVDPFGRK